MFNCCGTIDSVRWAHLKSNLAYLAELSIIRRPYYLLSWFPNRLLNIVKYVVLQKWSSIYVLVVWKQIGISLALCLKIGDETKISRVPTLSQLNSTFYLRVVIFPVHSPNAHFLTLSCRIFLRFEILSVWGKNWSENIHYYLNVIFTTNQKLSSVVVKNC